MRNTPFFLQIYGFTTVFYLKIEQITSKSSVFRGLTTFRHSICRYASSVFRGLRYILLY